MLNQKINYILSQQKNFLSVQGLNLMYDRKSNRYKELAGPNTKYILIIVGSEAKTDVPNVKNFTKLGLVKAFKPSRKTKKLKKRIRHGLPKQP